MENKRTFFELLNTFFKKIIYCPQKVFFANGDFFYNGRPSPIKSNMIAFNKNHVLKIENFKHRNKRNNLNSEAEILKYLKNKKGVSQPDLICVGKHWTRRPYYIMEKIRGKTIDENIADLLLSIIEQQRLGVFHNDIKWDNVFFDGLIVRMIDYDQAYFEEKLEKLSLRENIEFFVSKLFPGWGEYANFSGLKYDLDFVKEKLLSYFDGDRFKFNETSLYKSFKDKPYYLINLDEIKEEGRNKLEDWYSFLDKIYFQDNERVLDCGCDTGVLTFYLSRRRCRVSSCDIERNSILTTRMLSNIYHIECEVFPLNSLNGEYDTIFLLNSDFIESINEETKQALIGKAKRVFIKIKNRELDKYPNSKIIHNLDSEEKIISV